VTLKTAEYSALHHINKLHFKIHIEKLLHNYFILLFLWHFYQIIAATISIAIFIYIAIFFFTNKQNKFERGSIIMTLCVVEQKKEMN